MLTKKTKKKSSDEELDLVKTVLTVSPRSIHDKQIPDAEVEIRSVIDTTEDTAGTILDVAERLGDVADGEAVTAAVAGSEAVIHVAGRVAMTGRWSLLTPGEDCIPQLRGKILRTDFRRTDGSRKNRSALPTQ